MASGSASSRRALEEDRGRLAQQLRRSTRSSTPPRRGSRSDRAGSSRWRGSDPPASAVAPNAATSVAMCRNAPRTFRLSRLARASTSVATRLTSAPPSATTSTRPPWTSRGSIRRWIGRPDDPEREQPERDPVRLRGEDLEPRVPERPAPGRRPRRHRRGDEREPERRRVGEHVPGVGEQRERVGERARDDLADHHGRDEDERDGQRAAVGC